MRRDPLSASLLIAGSLAIVLVMSHHPTGAAIMDAEHAEWHAGLSAIVHGAAIVAIAVLVMGFVGVSRGLGFSATPVAALVAYGLGAVAGVSAAVVSGFVAPEVILRAMAAEGPAAAETFDALRAFSWMLNQGFAKVHVVASSVAVVLWSVALLRVGRPERAAGVAGILVGLVTLVVFFAGAVQLDVAGFGAIMFAQAAWGIWLGVVLLREGGARGRPVVESEIEAQN